MSENFQYTYSAEQQEEIKSIRKKYLPPEEDKMEQLRRLDAAVNKKASVTALTVGILGTLVMGTGMSCAMVWQGWWFIPGIILGLAGMAVIAFAYPIYRRVTEKEREKIAPVILALADELMK